MLESAPTLVTLVVVVHGSRTPFSCEVTHQDWRSGSSNSSSLERNLVIGRDPGKSGLVVGANDSYVSSRAAELIRRKDGVEVRNTSSHTDLDVQQSNALRHIFPGERIVMISSFTIYLPSKDFTYQVKVEIDGLEAAQQRTGGTRSLLSQRIVISDERLPALAGLCATFLYPNRFGTSPMKASQIAEILTSRGFPVTAKAVKHKIQRTKDQVEQATGNYVDDREGLAQFLIRNRLVTAEHVKQYLIGDVSGDERL